MSSAAIVGILLAAGRGLRFGADKTLYPLADGTPMALAAARGLRAACARCITVLRPEQQALAAQLSEAGFAVHFDPGVAAGMGHSLAAAVRLSADAAGWVVALADMPFVPPAVVIAVADALRDGASLAAPYHGGRRAHPVGFAARWGDALGALQGDRGARDLLAAQVADIRRIECTDAGVGRDLDTPEALA